jgi:hypothetical protein
MESWQIFYWPRHKGKQHLALRGVSPTGWRPNSEVFKSSIDIFSIHDLFTRLPRRLMSWLYHEFLKKITMPKLMIGCQGQWRAGPTNNIIYQPDGTPNRPTIPSFHCSSIPNVSEEN